MNYLLGIGKVVNCFKENAPKVSLRGEFLYKRKPPARPGSSKKPMAIKHDKKTPFGVSLRSGNCEETPKGGQTK